MKKILLVTLLSGAFSINATHEDKKPVVLEEGHVLLKRYLRGRQMRNNSPSPSVIDDNTGGKTGGKNEAPCQAGR